MNNSHFARPIRRSLRALMVATALSFSFVAPGLAQDAIPRLAIPAAEPPLTTADLELLVGPIALYADDLIGIVLPASTYPLQIVQARRFLDRLEFDASLEPDPDWDNTVVALLNYPEVLRLMDENIDWTWALGEAVLDQQSGVMDAIQTFRRQAYLAGNLQSDSRQTIVDDDGAIEISPANPEVIYIPYYEPQEVVVIQPRPVYFYYSSPYPIYYYPYPVGYRFSSRFFWGVTSVFDIGWHNHYVNVYSHRHIGHPYYNHVYHTPYYARRGINININLNHTSNVWEPRNYRAARPHRLNNGQRTVVRSGEGYSQQNTRTATQRAARTNEQARARQRAGQSRVAVPAQRGVQAGTQSNSRQRVTTPRTDSTRLTTRNSAGSSTINGSTRATRNVPTFAAPTQQRANTQQRSGSRASNGAQNRVVTQPPAQSPVQQQRQRSGVVQQSNPSSRQTSTRAPNTFAAPATRTRAPAARPSTAAPRQPSRAPAVRSAPRQPSSNAGNRARNSNGGAVGSSRGSSQERTRSR